jgi:hypothetical protein
VTTDFGSDTEANGFNYTATEEKQFVRSDTNGDGQVDLADAVSIFNDLFLGQPALATCRDALDVDDNGSLEITDGIAVLAYLFQGGPEPNPPYPNPGLDPTDDDLEPCL